MNGWSKLENIAKWLFLAATFFLIFRTKDLQIKVADILFFLAGLAILIQPSFYQTVRRQWRLVWVRWAKYAVLLIASVVFAQVFSYLRYNLTLRSDIILDYARFLFNIGVFSLTAFLIYAHNRKLVTRLSLAILLSFAAVLPAYIARWQNHFTAIGRLSGLLENPIGFAAWAMVAFLVGLGFFLRQKKIGLKILISLWLSILASFIIWSSTRSAWVSLPFGIAALAAFYLKKRGFVKIYYIVSVTVISFLAGYVIFSYTSQSRPVVEQRIVNLLTKPLADNQDRTAGWSDSFKKNLRNPIGFGFYGKNLPRGFPGSVNTYLQFMGSGGIVALFTFFLMIRQIWANIKSALKTKNGEGADDLYLAWYAVLPALLVDIFFSDYLLVRIVWFALGVILGVSLRKQRADATLA